MKLCVQLMDPDDFSPWFITVWVEEGKHWTYAMLWIDPTVDALWRLLSKQDGR